MSKRKAQRGMTLIEIMIVLAIIALVMGLLVGPRVMILFSRSKEKIAALAVGKLANEAYPQWASSHPDKSCPDTLDELSALSNNKDATDPWGHAYQLRCPPIAISSVGPDGQEGTRDDIKSF